MAVPHLSDRLRNLELFNGDFRNLIEVQKRFLPESSLPRPNRAMAFNMGILLTGQGYRGTRNSQTKSGGFHFPDRQ